MSKTSTIPQELYQFTDERALVIVAAKQEGRIMRAGNGELTMIEEFRIDTPHFSDNEALPQERGEQSNELQEKIHHEYFDHFKTKLHELAPYFKPTHAYLFAPKHVADELEKIMHPIFGAIPSRPSSAFSPRNLRLSCWVGSLVSNKSKEPRGREDLLQSSPRSRLAPELLLRVLPGVVAVETSCVDGATHDR